MVAPSLPKSPGERSHQRRQSGFDTSQDPSQAETEEAVTDPTVDYNAFGSWLYSLLQDLTTTSSSFIMSSFYQDLMTTRCATLASTFGSWRHPKNDHGHMKVVRGERVWGMPAENPNSTIHCVGTNSLSFRLIPVTLEKWQLPYKRIMRMILCKQCSP